jgi:hypothetical protein
MSLTRTCRISGKEFIITDEDLAFYDTISPVIGGKKYLIPPPTLCPEERLKRRLSWRNLYNLYKSTCAYSGKEIIAFYAPNRGYKVAEQKIWWSDVIENLDVGRAYDFDRTFTEQFDPLFREAYIPCLSTTYMTNQNSEYVNGANNVKDCYLAFNIGTSENCEYCESTYDSHDTLDSYFVRNCSLCYDSVGIMRCHSCTSLEESEDCSRVDFCYNMRWCHDCLLSFGQENQSYLIGNRQYTKEEYEEESEKYKLPDGWYDYGRLQDIFEKMKRENDIKTIIIYNSENVSGNHISNCFNVHGSTDIADSKNCKYSNTIGKWEDVYDCFSWGYTIEKSYENVAVGSNASHIIGCYAVFESTHDMYYSYSCYACSNCFGCVGLKHKQYCILNTQYTKEEYEELVGKIIEKMILDKEWGEYFSPENSPWWYNETMAHLYFPLEKQKVLGLGFQWNDYEAPRPEATKYIPALLVPENIADIPDDILNWAIESEVSGKYYKINRPELEFYRKHHLPIPRKHPDERRQRRHARRVQE